MSAPCVHQHLLPGRAADEVGGDLLIPHSVHNGELGDVHTRVSAMLSRPGRCLLHLLRRRVPVWRALQQRVWNSVILAALEWSCDVVLFEQKSLLQ